MIPFFDYEHSYSHSYVMIAFSFYFVHFLRYYYCDCCTLGSPWNVVRTSVGIGWLVFIVLQTFCRFWAVSLSVPWIEGAFVCLLKGYLTSKHDFNPDSLCLSWHGAERLTDIEGLFSLDFGKLVVCAEVSVGRFSARWAVNRLPDAPCSPWVLPWWLVRKTKSPRFLDVVLPSASKTP